MSREGKAIESESRSMASYGWGWHQGLSENRYEGTVWEDGNVLKLHYNDGFATQ